MKYANETLVLWYMAMCSFIVLTNAESHVPFIGTHVAILGLYKWLQERENAKANQAIRSDTV